MLHEGLDRRIGQTAVELAESTVAQCFEEEAESLSADGRLGYAAFKEWCADLTDF